MLVSWKIRPFAPPKRKPEAGSSSKHLFSGANLLLVSGRVFLWQIKVKRLESKVTVTGGVTP